MLSQKVLLGLNFYGYKYEYPVTGAPEAYTAPRLLQTLQDTPSNRASVRWREVEREHVFTVKQPDGSIHSIYFPTIWVWAHSHGRSECNVFARVWRRG